MNVTCTGNRSSSGPASGWRRVFRIAQWIVIPLLVFATVEIAVRRAEQRFALPIGWNWPDFGGVKLRFHYYFLGSSRVAAAVDQGEFSQRLSEHTQHPTVALNLGHGWSYLVQNHLYLRNLLDADADVFRGAVVIIELPGGRLAFEGQHWSGQWFEQDYPFQLVTELRRKDLPRLWSTRMNLEDKLSMTFGLATRRCELLTRRGAIGHFLRQQCECAVLACCEGFLPRAADAGRASDLTTAVGIRADQAGIQSARRLAVQAANRPAPIEPVEQADDRVIDDLVAMIQQAGGKVVFYEMPLHSAMSGGHATADWQARRAEFAAWAADRGIAILTTDFHAVDDDFPDMWHLRQSRSADFTNRLASSFIEETDRSSQRPELEMAKHPHSSTMK
ncbi:MAG TPA: hypothetical protein VFI31_05905 [Pirellulales bacterium]|nr:hypothetical protein [Pirellulales bacterium]